jgi:pyridoxine kinase
MYAILAATHEDGVEEMALIAEQDAIAQPDERFEVVELG